MSLSGDYLLDCSLAGDDESFIAFVPVEFDGDGNVKSVVVGMTYISSSPPPGGRFVGVFHQDGQEACDAWCEAHSGVIDRLIAERDAT